MKYYTIEDILKLKPCYHRKKLEEYMKGRKRISLSGILKSKVSDANKVWLVVRLLPTAKAIEFAEWCFNSVICSGNAYTAYISYTAAKSAEAAESTAIWAVDAAYEAAFISYKTARDDEVTGRAWNAWENYDKARRNQVNQLKLIVKEHNL